MRSHMNLHCRGFTAAMLISIAFAAALPAQAAPEGRERLKTLWGPRVGVAYGFYDFAAFKQKIVTEMPWADPAANYYPILSQFGATFEQRILLGTSNAHFAIQENVVIGGLEQGLFFPTVSLFFGARIGGFEFGLGPVAGLGYFGVGAAAGYTIEFEGVYVPIDIVFIPDLRYGHHSLSIYTGFNFYW